MCGGHRLGLEVKVIGQGQRPMFSAKTHGNAVTRSVWPRSSIDDSFSSEKVLNGFSWNLEKLFVLVYREQSIHCVCGDSSNWGVLRRLRLSQLSHERLRKIHFKQGVALTGRNRTGPPCSVSRPTAHAPGGSRPSTRSLAHAPGRPARRQYYRRRQTTTTDTNDRY